MDSKVLVMIIPLLIAVLLGCQSRGEDEVIIVPQGYTGYVLIIYGQKNGASPKYEDERRIYEIPSDGILKTQFSNNPGWTNLPKFYYGSISSENEIPFKIEYEEVPTDSVAAFGGSAGYASRDLEGKKGVRYLQYFVGTKSQMQEAADQVEKLDIASLAE